MRVSRGRDLPRCSRPRRARCAARGRRVLRASPRGRRRCLRHSCRSPERCGLRRGPRDRVPARAQPDGGDHVGDVGTADDRGRPAINHPVIDLARDFVAASSGAINVPLRLALSSSRPLRREIWICGGRVDGRHLCLPFIIRSLHVLFTAGGGRRVCGPAHSTTLNLQTAGEESRLPVASIAVAVKECLPSFSFFALAGEVHGFAAFRSSLHSKVEPGSSEENSNLAFGFAVFRFGPLPLMVSGESASAASPVPPPPSLPPHRHRPPASPAAPVRRAST